ncbi:uncharacterized protein si:rp71-17i16.6 [Colossoma macropomum]|uniref:uncharacterized protein si:rp71-17i16.6 n=1 Tax=Colossoma macropomum TaxID=42526 RepID=UPI0018642BE9|nr:uncharacterized protein si:rp71-17i16.6 [Colossoma macropomum]
MTDQNTDMHCVQSGSTFALGGSNTDYRQYLRSVFGESTAEYFLNPSSLLINNPAWYTQMKDSMKDNVSAEALWAALRQHSAQILKKMEAKPSQAEKLSADWEGLMRQDHLLHLSGIRLMFRLAQRNQAYTALLLQHRPLSLLCDPDMTEGPRQYLPEKNMD